MKKKIILILLLIVIVAGAIIAKMWYKPHPKAENQDAISVTAASVFKEYSADEQGCNTRYLNKVLAVTGTVASVDTNQDGAIVVVLQSDDPLNGVVCTMRDKNASVAKGSQVTIKGFCSGFVGDVKLTDCITK
ncbi:OB-fold protein [Chitinophagaceae bacterium MMS25-I14]